MDIYTSSQPVAIYQIEQLPDAIEITIHRRRKWYGFIQLLIYLPVYLFTLPLIGLFLFALASEHLPDILLIPATLLIPILLFYFVRKPFKEIISSISHIEIIRVDEQSITVERSGTWFFKSRYKFLAKNIKGFISSPALVDQSSFFSRFLSPVTLLIWRRWRLVPFRLGHDLSEEAAQKIVGSIYSRYPCYSYSEI